MAGPLFDAIEREQLCDLLDGLGPDAPTILDVWTTHDLAAHLVLRERDFLNTGHWPARRQRYIAVHRAADDSVTAISDDLNGIQN